MVPIVMPGSKANASLWAEAAEVLGTERQPVTGSKFDIAIIGGGFSGLWSAFNLINLDPNLKVAIFEARTFGFGASGRNGG